MSDKILRSFEEGRFNPFQFRHVVVVHSMQDLRKVRPPMVVLASSPDMESGFARELFTEWCSNEKNCVLLTNRSTSGTLARRLIDHYCINFKISAIENNIHVQNNHRHNICKKFLLFNCKMQIYSASISNSGRIAI